MAAWAPLWGSEGAQGTASGVWEKEQRTDDSREGGGGPCWVESQELRFGSTRFGTQVETANDSRRRSMRGRGQSRLEPLGAELSACRGIIAVRAASLARMGEGRGGAPAGSRGQRHWLRKWLCAEMPLRGPWECYSSSSPESLARGSVGPSFQHALQSASSAPAGSNAVLIGWFPAM